MQKLFIGIVLVLTLAYSVQADLTITNPTKLTIDVDYATLNDADKSLFVQGSLPLKGTDPAMKYTFSVVNVKSGYTLTLTQSSLEIGANELSLGYTLKAPAGADQGIADGIATIKAVDTQGKEYIFPLKTNVISMVDIKRIKFYVNDIEEKSISDDNTEVKGLEPGDKVELRFQLSNLFNKNYDYGDIEGTVSIKLDDNDFSQDVDEEEDFVIGPGEKFDIKEEEIVLSFTIPQKAKDTTYEMNIKVKGKDDNKARYETEWLVNLKVQRQYDDLRFDSFTVEPQEISCGGEVLLTAKVVNYGKDRQKHAALEFSNSKLNFKTHEEFELGAGVQDDNFVIKQTKVNVGKDITPGLYSLIATAYYDYTIMGAKENVNLQVKECIAKENKTKTVAAAAATTKESDKEAEVEETTTKTGATIAPTVTPAAKQDVKTDAVKISSTSVAKTIETPPYTLEDAFIGLIIVGVVIILGMITLSIALLLRR